VQSNPWDDPEVLSRVDRQLKDDPRCDKHQHRNNEPAPSGAICTPGKAKVVDQGSYPAAVRMVKRGA
jgi:hypothetical protein